ncbi:MAG: YkgJ family cysteine cluster protein [Candidatus Hodarchaeota archaeon]
MAEDEAKSSNEEEEEPEEDKKDSTDAQPKPKKKKKYVFNCTKCGECCTDRTSVPVTFLDLERWINGGVIQSLFQYLELETVKIRDDIPEFLHLTLKKADGEAGCPLYDVTNKICNIYHSLPTECDAFPLGYNGRNFLLKMKNCPGLGQGKMTTERLADDRRKAKEDFEAKTTTTSLLPLINTVFFKHMMKQQEEMMTKMPKDQREKLEEILKTSKESQS